VLENAGIRHGRPRAFDAIAKEASAAGRNRGLRGYGRWLAQGRHDQVTLSAALVAVKDFLY
jgi:hypothetical protein